ncbi:MAG TPA: hypothetical protein DEP20_02685 [Fusobacteria bacterium]|nr:hypothetical protein [Fusobacteriota bacterium]|tara:strand:+ start:8970 stop:9218 length:249 start_codon:yes stop_codon:yes gene_type:complete
MLEMILISLFRICNAMLTFLWFAVIISIFIPHRVAREGFPLLIKEFVDPIYNIFGQMNIGPVTLSPIVVLTLIEIMMYAMKI